jgi:hypothetical protein
MVPADGGSVTTIHKKVIRVFLVRVFLGFKVTSERIGQAPGGRVLGAATTDDSCGAIRLEMPVWPGFFGFK